MAQTAHFEPPDYCLIFENLVLIRNFEADQSANDDVMTIILVIRDNLIILAPFFIGCLILVLIRNFGVGQTDGPPARRTDRSMTSL